MKLKLDNVNRSFKGMFEDRANVATEYCTLPSGYHKQAHNKQ